MKEDGQGEEVLKAIKQVPGGLSNLLLLRNVSVAVYARNSVLIKR